MDGSIHQDQASAKKRAHDLEARMPKRATRAKPTRGLRERKAAPGGKSWVQHVLEAVHAGAESPATIKQETGIDARILHPTLSNLRKRGLLKGKAGSIAITKNGLAFLKKE
jgi:hypothetical protein